MKYEIPKEIKSKPKILGMEMKELSILLVGFLLLFTVLLDNVHRVFVVPYLVLSVLSLLWVVLPSRMNPGMKNYKSLYLFQKHNRLQYHPLDVQKIENEEWED